MRVEREDIDNIHTSRCTLYSKTYSKMSKSKNTVTSEREKERKTQRNKEKKERR